MRSFATSLIVPAKRGSIGAQAITAHMKSNQPPQSITFDVAWRDYALQMNIAGGVTTFNAGVSIDLTRGFVTNPFDMVKSVFIDNTAVDRPVYLRCEDTQQVITCADGFSGWFPTITNGEQFTIFTDNIIPLRDGKQATRIILSNVSFDTFASPELNRAQQLFRTSGSSQFVTPVIGDKLVSKAIADILVSGTTEITIIPSLANSQVVITAIQINQSRNEQPQNAAQFFIPSIKYGPAKTILTSAYAYNGNQTNGQPDPIRKNIINLPVLQVPISGENNILFSIENVSNASIFGSFDCQITYSQIVLPALS